jgi:hypothetical protein
MATSFGGSKVLGGKVQEEVIFLGGRAFCDDPFGLGQKSCLNDKKNGLIYK